MDHFNIIAHQIHAAKFDSGREGWPDRFRRDGQRGIDGGQPIVHHRFHRLGWKQQVQENQDGQQGE